MLSDNFTGYILAGGKSSRMGRDKAFLEIGDKTFVENAVDALKPNCSQVKIVLNKSQTHFIEKLPSNIPYVFDLYENRGAPGGIHAALQDCETEFAVILAVDLPFVMSKTIAALAKIALSENVAAIIPRQNDCRLQPLCAVYRVINCLPKIEKLLDEKESASVRNFLDIINTKSIEAGDLSADENLFTNINYPQDFKYL
jgi:molybdopterin-guanine dinucleotide biosynthesis protein A